MTLQKDAVLADTHTHSHAANFFQTHIRIFDDVISTHACEYECAIVGFWACASAHDSRDKRSFVANSLLKNYHMCTFLARWMLSRHSESIFGFADFANSPFLITAIQHRKWFFSSAAAAALSSTLSPRLHFWLRIILDYTETLMPVRHSYVLWLKRYFAQSSFVFISSTFFFFFFFVRSFVSSRSARIQCSALSFTHFHRGGQLSKYHIHMEHLIVVRRGIVTTGVSVCALCEMPRWNKCASVCNKIL